MISALLMMLNAVFAAMVVIDEIPGDNGVTTTYNNTLNATEFKICVNNDTSGQLLLADIAVNDSILVYNNTANATGERMINCLAEQDIDHSSWVTTNVDLIDDYEQLTVIEEEITQWVSYSWRRTNTSVNTPDQSELAEDDSYLPRIQAPGVMNVNAYSQKNCPGSSDSFSYMPSGCRVLSSTSYKSGTVYNHTGRKVSFGFYPHHRCDVDALFVTIAQGSGSGCRSRTFFSIKGTYTS